MCFRKIWEKNRKKMSFSDFVSLKLSCTAFGVLLAAIFPRLIEINIWWIVAVFIVFGLKPFYHMFVK
ncbi:MAG: hypothetical protein J7J92_00850 [Candidatus Aenigmarchaeota archaeon]|nr:hypothetical protein [Candidatus Aenigmarchaeota archaeon]